MTRNSSAGRDAVARTKLLGFEPESTKLDRADLRTDHPKRLVRPSQLRVLVVDKLNEKHEFTVAMLSDSEKLFDVGEA